MSNAADRLAEVVKEFIFWFENDARNKVPSLHEALRAYEAEKEIREAEQRLINEEVRLHKNILATGGPNYDIAGPTEVTRFHLVTQILATRQAAKASPLATDDPKTHQQARDDHDAERIEEK